MVKPGSGAYRSRFFAVARLGWAWETPVYGEPPIIAGAIRPPVCARPSARRAASGLARQADPDGMSLAPRPGCAKLGTLPDDLYGYLQTPKPRVGRPPRHDFSRWRVADDWPATVPISDAES